MDWPHVFPFIHTFDLGTCKLYIYIVYSGMRLMFPIAMHTIEIIKQYNTCTLYIHNSKR